MLGRWYPERTQLARSKTGYHFRYMDDNSTPSRLAQFPSSIKQSLARRAHAEDTFPRSERDSLTMRPSGGKETSLDVYDQYRSPTCDMLPPDHSVAGLELGISETCIRKPLSRHALYVRMSRSLLLCLDAHSSDDYQHTLYEVMHTSKIEATLTPMSRWQEATLSRRRDSARVVYPWLQSPNAVISAEPAAH